MKAGRRCEVRQLTNASAVQKMNAGKKTHNFNGPLRGEAESSHAHPEEGPEGKITQRLDKKKHSARSWTYHHKKNPPA